jgi:anti-anti-sigma factor
VKIDESVTGGLGILRLSGRLTVNDAPGMLKGAVLALLAGGVRHVVLDLSEVRFIDSTRLGELIAAHLAVAQAEGRLVLAGTPPRILELLTLSNLADVFERVESVAAATSELASPLV